MKALLNSNMTSKAIAARSALGKAVGADENPLSSYTPPGMPKSFLLSRPFPIISLKQWVCAVPGHSPDTFFDGSRLQQIHADVVVQAYPAEATSALDEIVTAIAIAHNNAVFICDIHISLGVNFGHKDDKVTQPIGCRAVLDATALDLQLLESPHGEQGQ